MLDKSFGFDTLLFLQDSRHLFVKKILSFDCISNQKAPVNLNKEQCATEDYDTHVWHLDLVPFVVFPYHIIIHAVNQTERKDYHSKVDPQSEVDIIDKI